MDYILNYRNVPVFSAFRLPMLEKSSDIYPNDIPDSSPQWGRFCPPLPVTPGLKTFLVVTSWGGEGRVATGI